MNVFRMLRRYRKVPLLILAALLVILIASNLWIVWTTKKHIHDQIETLPQNEIGLLLGTSRYVRSGALNPHFTHRIEAAARLYKAGKIQRILASGHHEECGYDEPYRMQTALIEQGVPEEAILLDLKGHRTLDSIKRTHEHFGFTKFTIISQAFHNARAVFIARHFDLDVVAFSAEDVPVRFGRFSKSREYFARVKALIDLYLPWF